MYTISVSFHLEDPLALFYRLFLVIISSLLINVPLINMLSIYLENKKKNYKMIHCPKMIPTMNHMILLFRFFLIFLLHPFSVPK